MSEAKVPEVGYEYFSERVHNQSLRQRLPLSGSIELTFACNFRCIHCYCVNEAPRRELSLEEMRGLVDQAVDAGCLWMLLTGGEPLLHRDFEDIYRYCRQKGLITTLFTNGSLVNERIAGMLSDFKPFVVEVTLYGFSPETYRAVTGRAEHFEKVLRGIDLLQEAGVSLQLKSMIMRQNIQDLPRIQEFAKSRGLNYRFDPMLNPTLSGSRAPEDMMLTPEEIVALDVNDTERMDSWDEFCEKFTFAADNGLLYKCGAGQWSFHIDPEGKLSLCMFARRQQYDLRNGNFHEAFYTFLPEVLGQKETRVTKCGACRIRNMCGQCPGWASLHSGDQEEPVEYLCQIAHARARAFGVKGL